MLRMILATTPESGIGYKGSMPWHIPEDLKSFKELTTGDLVVMGRNTYDSIVKIFPNGLPNRTNYVITTHGHGIQDNGVIFITFDQVVDMLTDPRLDTIFQHRDVWFIGGAMIYNSLIDYMDEVYLTLIPYAFECDTWTDDETFGKALTEDFSMVEWKHLANFGKASILRFHYVRNKNV